MQFTTKVPIPNSNYPINYDSKIMAIGSCFAENMAAKLSYFKFQNEVNPFGIIFNPVSIEKLIRGIVHQKTFTEKDIFFHNELWHCYDAHSDLSCDNKQDFLDTLNSTIKESKNQISNASHIIITYGTSWIYELKSSHEIVANCHKVPQSQFDKKILAVTSIENAMENTIDLVRKVNPDCSFIFTVSPVRHIKDGFVENQRSKSHLIAAIHNLIPQQKVSYFPSYEIVMDELRDYRFYSDDMLHPSSSAIDYIWERFFTTQMEESAFPIMEEVGSIQKSLSHRPFYPFSESHQKFVENLNQKIAELTKKHPQIRF